MTEEMWDVRRPNSSFSGTEETMLEHKVSLKKATYADVTVIKKRIITYQKMCTYPVVQLDTCTWFINSNTVAGFGCLKAQLHQNHKQRFILKCWLEAPLLKVSKCIISILPQDGDKDRDKIYKIKIAANHESPK